MAQTPGFNLGEIMKQAQALQQSFEENKQKLKQETATATVGGGMVSATVDGEKQLKEIKISPELLTEDVSTIEDLVVSAVNAANAEIEKKINVNMAAFAGNALSGLGGAGLGDMANMLGGPKKQVSGVRDFRHSKKFFFKYLSSQKKSTIIFSKPINKTAKQKNIKLKNKVGTSLKISTNMAQFVNRIHVVDS